MFILPKFNFIFKVIIFIWVRLRKVWKSRKSNCESLHRSIWSYYNGEIPEGYHIHHIDEDKSNNAIENLRLIEGREHLRMHMLTPERQSMSRESIKIASEKAKEWHVAPLVHSPMERKIAPYNWQSHYNKRQACTSAPLPPKTSISFHSLHLLLTNDRCVP